MNTRAIYSFACAAFAALIATGSLAGCFSERVAGTTPPGGAIRLSVSVMAAGDALVLTVTDSGIGISRQALDTIFDPFMQESRAAELDPSGMGLGLTVAMTVVRAHGGRLAAHSAGVGAGCEFELTLPLRPDRA